MKNKVKNVLLYIVKNYPSGEDLTITRITKLVYLIDREYTKKYGKQITEISWYFDRYGPYASDVFDKVNENETIAIQSVFSNFGTTQYIVRPQYDKELIHYEGLDDSEIETINEVFKDTKILTWNQFINRIYATRPIKESSKYSHLDLVRFIPQP